MRKADPGCFLGYISQTDPKGKLPSWLVNKITQKFAPKVVKQLKRAAEGYEIWKDRQCDPRNKPWICPELTLMRPRIKISDVSNRKTKNNAILRKELVPHSVLNWNKLSRRRKSTKKINSNKYIG